MNTSPHDMHMRNEAGELIVFEKGPQMVRCDQEEGEIETGIKGVRVRKATPYSLNREDLKQYKGADVLLCSTILANFHKEIKEELGDKVRILVPNSGASAERKDGKIICKEFLEYYEDVGEKLPIPIEGYHIHIELHEHDVGNSADVVITGSKDMVSKHNGKFSYNTPKELFIMIDKEMEKLPKDAKKTVSIAETLSMTPEYLKEKLKEKYDITFFGYKFEGSEVIVEKCESSTAS